MPLVWACLARYRRDAPVRHDRLDVGPGSRRAPTVSEATAEWYLDRGDPLHAMEHLVLAGRTDRLEQVDRADRWLAEVDMSATLASADQVCATLAATIALARARYDDRVADELAQLESTWSGVEEDDDLALLARHHRGVARLYVGRYEDAIADLEQVGRVAHLTRRDGLRLSCLSFIAGTEASMSRLPDMRRHADEALELAARRGWTGSRATAHAYMLAAWSAYLRADHATASRNAAAATLALGRHADPDVELATRTVALLVAADEEEPFEALVEYRAAFQRLAHAQMSRPARLRSTRARSDRPGPRRTCLGSLGTGRQHRGGGGPGRARPSARDAPAR